MPAPKQQHGSVILITSLVLMLAFGSGCRLARSRDDAAVMPASPTPFGSAVLLGHLENRNITEASGMAASRRNPGVLWIINDGGDSPVLYAVGMQGAHLGRVRIRNAQNVDWEDLAAFRINNSAMLLIADVGDNHARREQNDLYFVREPDISGLPAPFDLSVDWHARLRFVYEDGARDCESVAVDPDNNQILLLTKRTSPPVLYTLPLKAKWASSVIVARRLTAIENMLPSPATSSPADMRFQQIRSQPTAMDISPDGLELAILTYGSGGYLYRRSEHLDWTKGFQKSPAWIALPPMRQPEALCFSADGQSLIVTSEQPPAPLVRLSRQSSSH